MSKYVTNCKTFEVHLAIVNVGNVLSWSASEAPEVSPEVAEVPRVARVTVLRVIIPRPGGQGGRVQTQA